MGRNATPDAPSEAEFREGLRSDQYRHLDGKEGLKFCASSLGHFVIGNLDAGAEGEDVVLLRLHDDITHASYTVVVDLKEQNIRSSVRTPESDPE